MLRGQVAQHLLNSIKYLIYAKNFDMYKAKQKSKIQIAYKIMGWCDHTKTSLF